MKKVVSDIVTTAESANSAPFGLCCLPCEEKVSNSFDCMGAAFQLLLHSTMWLLGYRFGFRLQRNVVALTSILITAVVVLTVGVIISSSSSNFVGVNSRLGFQLFGCGDVDLAFRCSNKHCSSVAFQHLLFFFGVDLMRSP